jgi:ABC-type polysaccharide/polyol phosphate export permease
LTSPLASLWASLAIARQDLRESFGHAASVVTMLFSTCMSLVVVALVLSDSSGSAGARLVYLYPGLVSVLCVNGLSTTSGRIQSDRQRGTLVMLMLSRSAAPAILAGHLASLAVLVLIQGVFLFGVMTLLVSQVAAGDPVAVLGGAAALVLGVVLYGSLGALVAIANPAPGLSQIATLVIMSISVVASTAYFTIERVPHRLQGIAAVNPVSFLCQAMRAALCLECEAPTGHPLLVLAAQAALVFGLAWFSMRRIEVRADR